MKGESEKRVYLRTYFVTLIIFILTLIISFLLYPESENYSIITHDISSLGNPDESSTGHFIFRIGIVIGGLLIIPHAIYLRRFLFPEYKPLNILSILSLIIFSLGLVMIGIFPESKPTYETHIIGAMMIIAGYFLSAFLMLPTLIKKIKLRKVEALSSPFISVIYLQILIVGLMIIIYIVVPTITNVNANYFSEMDNYPEKFEICEWFVLFSMNIWLGCIVFTCSPKIKMETYL
jgi:hypothetical membrane protein